MSHPEEIAGRLVRWYGRHGRDLPWRRRPTPYRVWVSEIMLQQTTVATAAPCFTRFVKRFPSVEALAAAREREVLGLWSGLGYYRRASNLLKAARVIRDRHAAKIPAEIESLRALPGVGPYTAGAILSIGHGLPYPAIDANVMRVVARLAAVAGDPARASTRRRIESLVREWIPPDDPSAFNQALMDLGAMICSPRAPSCGQCPLASTCRARIEGLTGSIPPPAAGRQPVDVRLAAIAVRKGNDVLLVLRSDGGLMNGMWDFPMVPAGEAPGAGEPAASLRARGATRVGEVRHTITRHRITISVYEARWPAGASIAGRRSSPGAVSEPAVRLAAGWEAGPRRWICLDRLVSSDGDLALTGAARKIARLLLSRASHAGVRRTGAGA